jgi:ketosteroid isomerase-like protein
MRLKVPRRSGQMEKADVDRWLDDYVAAWKSYDRQAITGLFAEDVRYRFHPYDEAAEGRDAVVGAWLGETDDPNASTQDPEGTYDAEYRTIAVDGDVAVATGTTTYTTEPGGAVDKVFYNCFVMRFDPAGKCRDFTEWFMKRPAQ